MTLNETLKHFSSYKIGSEINRGIEREALRVTAEGRISQEKHPDALGSALTHPFITTDYSEALLEFVTPVFNDPQKLLNFLEQLHVFTLKNIGEEVLWNNSMPCFFKSEDQIPIADYGQSNIGKMKTVYRHGLKHRYGDVMQTISGIHFNISLSDHFFSKFRKVLNSDLSLQEFRSREYMKCIRNIHKHSWLIPYFFGSSPAICKSFINKSPITNDLEEFDYKGTLTFKGATTLRLSDLGYTNSEQDRIAVCYNSIGTYVKGLRKAITEESEKFKKIEVKTGDNYKQLNTNILQLENEYYAEVRPKRRIHTGESPTNALLDRGIEYIELRSVDVNSYSPIGLELEQILFLDLFILYCLFSENDEQTPEKSIAFRENIQKMAKYGRAKDILLYNGTQEVGPIVWGKQIFSELRIIAKKLDQEKCNNQYQVVLDKYLLKLEDCALLNSSKQLLEMKNEEETFYRNVLNRSLKFSKQLKNKDLAEEFTLEFQKHAENSLRRQVELEASDQVNFEEYLNKYFQQNVT
jgi:glutamate--cysteine ligase